MTNNKCQTLDNEYIGISRDCKRLPGIRTFLTFLTCLTEDNVIKYGPHIAKKIENIHCQIINKLTENYKTIVIGKLNVASICSKEKSELNNMQKRIVYILGKWKLFQGYNV